MRDKLYKTNRKVGFYRFRAFLVAFLFLGISAAALTLPYPYVVQAINAYQAEQKEQAEISEIVEEVDSQFV